MASFTAQMIELLATASSKNDFKYFRDLLFGERYPLCCFGLSAEFLFDCRGDDEHEQRVIELSEFYYKAAVAKPDLIVGGERVEPLQTPEQVAAFAQSERRKPAKLHAYGYYFVNQIPDTRLSHYKFSCVVDRNAYPFGGHIYLTWPVPNDDQDYESFSELFREFARVSRATYAVGGMALLYDTYASTAPEVCFPLYKRFPGFVYADSVRFAMARMRDRRAIRDVNWLTAVGAEIAGSLGDLTSLREAVSDEVAITPFEGGLLFRAGRRPVLGDANRRDVPLLYREVGKILSSHRVSNYGARGYLRVPTPFDAVTGSQEWLVRFD